MNDQLQAQIDQEKDIRRLLKKCRSKDAGLQAPEALLAELGEYYDADRVCILAAYPQSGRIRCAFQWNRGGTGESADNVYPEADGLTAWLETLEAEGVVLWPGEQVSELPSFLKTRGIRMVMAAPTAKIGDAAGILCVENPGKHTANSLLLSVAASVCRPEPLDQSLQETEVNALDRNHIIQSLSEIYTSVYYIDVRQDRYWELASVGEVRSYIPSSGNAQECLNFYCRKMMLPEYTQQMLSFVELSSLDERLRHEKIISRQYQSVVKVSPDRQEELHWIQCSFIEGDRDENGSLAHVIFATESIHDAKIRELEAAQKLRRTNMELESLLAAEKRHTAIIGAMSNVFFALYYIDLTENTFQEVYQGDVSRSFGEKEDARNALRYITEALVASSHQPLMRGFTDFDTIDDRLGDKSIIIQDFLDRDGGWVRAAIFPVEKGSDGRNHSVLCTFRRITAEKETLVSQDNLIQALAIPYENIYAVNADTGEAVSYRMGQTINDRYGQKFAAGNYECNIGTYIRCDVMEEDRGLFDSVRTIDGVNRLLSDRKAYYFNYRVARNEQVCFFQCQLVKPNPDRNEFVIAFKNVDEEKKQELAQQEKLADALKTVEEINAALWEETAISSALSQEYHSLFKIDAKTGKLSLYRTDGMGLPSQMMEGLLKVGNYETVMAKYINTFVVPEDRDRLRQFSGLNVLMERVPEVGLYKLGYRRILNGVISYYEMNVVKTVDQRGVITFIMGLRDVDEEMRRQLKLTREMETQREIIEGLGSEYYSVLLVNPLQDSVTTSRAQDEEGQAIAEYFRRHNHCWSRGIQSYAEEWVSESSRQEFLQKLSLEYFRQEKKDYSFTYEKQTGGDLVYLQARVSFVHAQDGSVAVVIGTRNVDDLIKKERRQEMALRAAYDAAEAANRAKTDFLSNMSHDIRTPMNGIIGMTAIAAAHIDDQERVRDSLQKITRASKHLLSLINEVLDMSKIESGKVNLVEEEFNLSELIDNLLSMTSAQLERHHHSLFVNISDVTHEVVVGDSLRIQKVFTNLMSNAVKYTPDGGKIHLSITEKPSNQAKVGCYEFVFEDNGIGMSEEFQREIFEPFARAPDRRVNSIQGTGLGMPISRNIVRMMGGDIKVESELGVGSRFTVTMYLKLQDTIEINCEKFVDLDVLVVDDDAYSLQSCCGMLNDLGMRAEGVSTGVQAVEKVVLHHQQRKDYFACIIDWKMPDMDGIATTRAIRRAVGRNVPIIIISAYDWADIEQEARAAGADAFISKPLFRSRLARTFSILLGAEKTPEQELPERALSSIQLTGRRALLAEDNDLNAEIAKELLEMTGLSVERVADGAEAVDRLCACEDGYYDIVFMDIQMPNMNGYDATRAIRAMDRSYCRQIPIVAMTANAFAEDVQAAKTVGMNEHIAKPLDMTVLARALNRWLR